MRSPAAIIFDLDGVLLDSEPIYLGAERDAINQYRGEQNVGTPVDTSEYIAKVLGRSGLESAQILVDTFSLPVDAVTFLATRDAKLPQAFGSVAPCEGAVELVRHLVDVLGVPCAIATSSCAALLAVKAKARPEIFRRMKAVVCADDVAKAKPEPLLFLEAARRLGIAPEDCLVFEDAPAGVLAAKRAGMRCVALRNQFVPRSVYLQAGNPDTIVIDSGSFIDFDLASIGLESIPNVTENVEIEEKEEAKSNVDHSLLFVYGTLKPGFPNHASLPSSATIHEEDKEWRTADPYVLVVEPSTKVPFLLRGNGGKYIKGVVYKVSAEGLAEMDKFEGVDTGFYSRERIQVRSNNGSSNFMESAYVYFRHNDAKGPKWATSWSAQKLSSLPKLDEYTLEHATGFIKREDRCNL